MTNSLEMTQQTERLCGFVEGMPFEGYARIPALSGSDLLKMRRSPMHYRFMKDNPQPPSEAMLLGTVTHTAILEPPLLGKVAIWGEKPEEKVRRGKVWDAFRAEVENDKLIMRRDNYEDVAMTVAAVHQYEPAHKLLVADGPCEVSMFWTDIDTGLYMKGRVDKLIPKQHMIVDLKRTRDCHPYRFGGQAFALGYYIKMAIYWSGYRQITGHDPKMRLIAIDGKPPYEAAVYRITKDVLTQGLVDWQTLLSRLQQCERTGIWPPEQEEETDLVLPNYAYTSEDELADLEYSEGE